MHYYNAGMPPVKTDPHLQYGKIRNTTATQALHLIFRQHRREDLWGRHYAALQIRQKRKIYRSSEQARI